MLRLRATQPSGLGIFFIGEQASLDSLLRSVIQRERCGPIEGWDGASYTTAADDLTMNLPAVNVPRVISAPRSYRPFNSSPLTFGDALLRQREGNRRVFSSP